MMCEPPSNPAAAPSPPLEVIDLGTLAYLPAYELQQQIHSSVVEGRRAPALLLVEHPPVITISKRASAPKNLVAPPALLARLGIDVQTTDRGGDITYHGPGQLVAYPIMRLTELGVNVGGYMRFLEEVVIQTVACFGVVGRRDAINTGVWVDPPSLPGGKQAGMPMPMPQPPAKLCAMGIRVRKNVTLHGLALNVTTDLSHFQTIVPCGLAGVGVTSLQKLLGDKCPPMGEVKAKLISVFVQKCAELQGK